jgi:hypothetical protein
MTEVQMWWRNECDDFFFLSSSCLCICGCTTAVCENKFDDWSAPLTSKNMQLFAVVSINFLFNSAVSL